MGRFWFFVLLLIVIIGGAGYFFLSHLNDIAKHSIEEYGTAATKTSVTVGSVNLGVFKGSGALTDLKVANPEGYATPSALSFANVTVKIDPKSVIGSGPIVVKEITVERPSVTYEAKGMVSNLGTIEKNVSDYANALGGGGSKGKGRKLIIENLYLRDGTIAISHSALGGEALSANLPLIHLTNIGKSSDGATAAAVTTQLLSAILSAAVKASVEALVTKLGPMGQIEKLGVPSVGNPLKDLLGGH